MEMFSSLLKCFPLLLHVVAERVLQLQEHMAICLFQMYAVHYHVDDLISQNFLFQHALTVLLTFLGLS